ncbi:hypothetical protein JYU34_000614 [Plutella xylostella]|uniref:CSN12-like protein n=1 Tax=Plutella xylostella TaxID=51655 RepID=A0ABQ7R855_PLUXY|nr:hypothetical protein JYU34_000614 [Plutella xylostella]
MATLTVDQYTENVERAFKAKQGVELGKLLSLRDEHVLSRPLQLCEIPLLVKGKGIAPIFDIVVAHLLCIKSIKSKDYIEASARQSACVASVVKLLQAQPEENWCLPLMYTVCVDLRLLAQAAEINDTILRGKTLEKAAESLLNCFRVCSADNRTAMQVTKRVGMLNVVNQLLKVYFRIRQLNLCKPLIRAIEASPMKDAFPQSQKITYKFFVGRKAVIDSDYKTADECLTYAFQMCNKDSAKNKRVILTYLVPVKMILGYMPSIDILQKYDLMQFDKLVTAVKAGNIQGIDDALTEHEGFFINSGIYLVVEKLKITGYRNLFRLVYLAEKKHVIDISLIQAALMMMGQDVDADETQSLVAYLIYANKIKGYISLPHKKLVVSKQNPFPRLTTVGAI